MQQGVRAILKTLFDYCKEAGFNHEHMIIAQELLYPTKASITIPTIKAVVYKYFNITEERGDSKTRKKEVVQARQIAMEFSYRLGQELKLFWSLATIGKEIGGKDHATVLHAKKTVNNLRETDRRYNAIYNAIEFEIRTKITYHDISGENDNSEGA